MSRGKIIIENLDLAAVEERFISQLGEMEIAPPIRTDDPDRRAAQKALDYMKKYGWSRVPK